MYNLQKQSKNEVTIIGKLVNVTTREGKTKAGKPYVSARLVVRVTQKYFGREETSDIPVSAFASQFQNNGSINPAYENIMKVRDLKTIENNGVAEADTVRVKSRTTLRENSYVSRNGNIINAWDISTSYVNRGIGDETASFRADIVILDMKEETNSEGDITGRLIVRGGIVQWGEKLDVLDFVIDDPNAAADVSRLWSVNDTVDVWGRFRVVSREEKKNVQKTSSWGEEAPIEISTKTVRELVLTGGEPYADDDFAYDIAEIKKGYNARKALREQMLIEAKSSTNAAPAVTAPKKATYDWEE